MVTSRGKTWTLLDKEKFIYAGVAEIKTHGDQSISGENQGIVRSMIRIDNRIVALWPSG